jgi:hypothetical protein
VTVGTVWQRLAQVKHWKMQGHPLRGQIHASVSGWTMSPDHRRMATAAAKLRSNESIEQMLFRFLAVLDERLEHGMPPSQAGKRTCAVCGKASNLMKFGEFYLCVGCDTGEVRA